MIINWWNLLRFNQNKVWQSSKIDWSTQAFGEIKTKGWMWWTYDVGLKACQRYYHELKKKSKNNTELQNAFKTYLQNGNGSARCGKAWTDTWYIPELYSKAFIKLSKIAYKSKLISEIAVNNIISGLDSIENFENLNGRYLPDLGIWGTEAKSFWKNYDLNITFIHPVKYHTEERQFTLTLIRNWVVQHKNVVIRC